MVVCFWMGFAALAGAHPLNLGLVEVGAKGTELKVTVHVHPDVAARLLSVAQATAPMVEARGGQLFSATLGTGGFAVLGEGCAWGAASAKSLEKSIRVEASAR